MNLDEIKNRLANLQKKPTQNKEQEKSVAFVPEVGKQFIRILPAKWNKENPFKELFFHYDIHHRVMLSPKSFGEKDPIIQFAEQLKAKAKKGQDFDYESWKLAKKLEPKMQVYVPVIVRGKEDEGVLLWKFGKEIYLQLLAMAEDEDIGDYTDIFEGRDITLETVGKESTGTGYNKTSVRVKTKQTPIHEDKEVIEKWLTDQPDPIELWKNRTFSYEEMKEALAKFLTPEEEAVETQDTSSSAFESSFETKSTVKEVKADITESKGNTPAVKKTNTEKFNALFEDDEDADGLPF